MQSENDSATTQAVTLVCTNTTRERKFIADFCPPPLAVEFADTDSSRTVKKKQSKPILKTNGKF